MPAFRLSAKSLEDLKSIGRFTLKSWGREQRNIYLSKLDESFHRLADQPHLGSARDDIRKGYRVYHVGRHLIFYRLVRIPRATAFSPACRRLLTLSFP